MGECIRDVGGHEVGEREVGEQSRRVLGTFGLTIDPARRREYRERGWWPDTTVLDEFDATCRAHGDREAVVGYRAGSATPGSATADRLTYAQLADRVERVASFLLGVGVRPGDVVSVQLPNWWQFPAVALATLRVGAVLNPVLPIHRAREISFATGMLRPRVYFAPRRFRSFDYPAMLAEIWPDDGAEAGSAAPTVVLVGPGPDAPGSDDVGTGDLHSGDLGCDHIRALSFETDVLGRPPSPAAGPGSHHDRGVDGDLVSDIQFTSGTTGEPKGVGHVHATLTARTRALFDALDVAEHDVVFMPSPVTHSTGLVYGVLAPLSHGMTTVLQDVWEPRAGLDIIAAERATWTFATTAFLVDIIRAQRAATPTATSLRYFIAGGAAIPPAVVTEADEVLGTRVVAVWGMTENGAVTFTRAGQGRDAAARSDGVPCPWMSARVVDPTGADLPVGQEGQLLVRGASQALGYVRRPERTGEAYDGDGWFRTGDIARLDADGGVRITGRLKDIIIRGGENIPVTEVETMLYAHPRVADIAIVPYPDERLGERACAVVVPRPGPRLTLGDLTSYLATLSVSKTYWPERVELVDTMPRTASGKIQKFVLRDLVRDLPPGERGAVTA
ncbi:AMP-binding protein [Frankia sp. CcI49]|uniref:AMP-binding protein n=1 Tax=Frankia sp. CcI49 TaxID=1745382 RepID=UPI000A006374|nr:AMP-binding protein [Frankia sp. CcI49]